jgi:hypothetical protein
LVICNRRGIDRRLREISQDQFEGEFSSILASRLRFPSLTTPEQWRLIQSRISDVFGESEALSLRLSLAGAGRSAVANPVDKPSEEDLLTR